MNLTNAEMLSGKRFAPAHLGHVLLLGLGVSGKASLAYLLAQAQGRVLSISIFGGMKPCDLSNIEGINAKCVTVDFGQGAIDNLLAHAGIAKFDVCIASPGISEFNAEYLSAKQSSQEIISEVEFAWRESSKSSKWVAITGTNGKTTTTALCAHVLQNAGINAQAVGNIGDACISAVGACKCNVFVAEVSSYQLTSTKLFAPNVAVLLNITPDHIHWHKTLENYYAAKMKLLANFDKTPGCVCVFDAACEKTCSLVKEYRKNNPHVASEFFVPVTNNSSCNESCENECYIDDAGTLCVSYTGKTHKLCNREELLIHGSHNAQNALFAAAASIALGASSTDISSALKTFAPLEHRLEPCGSVRGVQCFNDSKATNVDATLKALDALSAKKPIVLLGGQDKGTNLDALVKAAHKSTSCVVCFGRAGKRFTDAFESASALAPASFCVLSATNFEEAFDTALKAAEDGDTILLSPSCASFDEFSSFEARGRAFKALVSARAASLGE